MTDELSALAAFVLDTVDGLRAATGAQAGDPTLTGVHIREITFSIPYDPGSQSLLLSTTSPPFAPVLDLRAAVALKLPDALRVLRTLSPTVVFDRARLVEVPEQRITRLEITIRL